MKRLLPAPLLSASLFVLWLVLNPPFGTGQAILGAIVAVVLPAITAPLRPLRVRLRRPPGQACRLSSGVEQLTRNEQVRGSNPRGGSM